ncbi:MAG: aspartate/glutamate racemase family protein [bacterium]
MAKDLTGKTLGIIHAGVWIVQTGVRFAKEIMPEVRLMHICDDSVQMNFMEAGVGNIPPANYYRFVTYAKFLKEAGADAVLFGCSTMNHSSELAAEMVDIPIIQIDRPMMEKAVRMGRRIGLLATLDTTVPSSLRLLKKVAEEAEKKIEIVEMFCGEAFERLMSGDTQGHDDLLLKEIEKFSDRVDVVVMAQLSMSVLEDKVKGFKIPVLNSGREGFTRAREILESL